MLVEDEARLLLDCRYLPIGQCPLYLVVISVQTAPLKTPHTPRGNIQYDSSYGLRLHAICVDVALTWVGCCLIVWPFVQRIAQHVWYHVSWRLIKIS